MAALVATAALVSGIGVAVLLTNRHSPAPASSAQVKPVVTNGGVTSEDQLLTAIRTQGLTPQRAQLLFALDVGPLPGVSVKGIKPEGGFDDGTVAVMDFYEQWQSIPKAVRDAAAALLKPSTSLAGPGLAANGAAPSAQPAAHRAQTGPQLVRAVLTAYTDAEFLQQAQIANAVESAALGALPIKDFVIDVTNVSATQEYANTTYYELAYIPQVQWVAWPDGCHIEISGPKMEGLGSEDMAAIMSHEVFHCFQQRAAGSNERARTVNPWVMEGEASWVMEHLHPANTVDDMAWFKYSGSPTKKYNARSYDAVGVYGHEGDLLGDQEKVWPLLIPVVLADIDGHDSSALAVLMGSDSHRFESTWGGSYFEEAAHVPWNMQGPGMPPTTGPTPRSVNIDNGDAQEIGLLGSYEAAQTDIQSKADILVINLASGYGEAHDQGHTVDQLLDTSAPLKLCIKQGGCTCPDGSPGASEQTIPATAPISVGLDGGDQSLAAYASGDSLDKYCKKPDDNPPPTGTPGGGSSSSGGGNSGDEGPETPAPPAGVSWGDPHLSTVDGSGYDLQAAGEFTLVKSASGDLVIQSRQVPLVGKPVAVNAAVAMKVDGHRVTFTLVNGAAVTRVDGSVVDTAQQAVGGGSLERFLGGGGLGFIVEWPDGSACRVTQMGTIGFDIKVTPAAAREGTLSGLLGNFNGDRSDDLAYANGTPLSSPTGQLIDGPYADSWRVTQGTSLFDYAPGQSTATFTNRSFPGQYVDSSNSLNAAAVKQECENDGITDPTLLADCVVDGSATGASQSVLSTYSQAQTVLTVQTALASNLPPFAPSSAPGSGGPAPAQTGTPAPVTGALNTIEDIGEVTVRDQTQPFTFQASAGDVLFIGPPDCNDASMVFELLDPNGKQLNPSDEQNQLGGCEDGRFILSNDGTYTLVANANMKEAGGAYKVPIRFDRRIQTFQTSYGQALSGTIPDQATEDRYLFNAKAGDIIHLGGAGCTVGPQSTWVELETSGGSTLRGLNCPTDGTNDLYEFQQSGSYMLVVNDVPLGPFEYHFVLQTGQ
ncbi:MAG: VWD domain-containing protein [Candidatus Dormibacteria bacterium]